MISQDWMERKLEEQSRLYERYGKALEEDHTGEFVAISLDGDILLDRKMGKLLRRATDTFGRDNFAMARVGHEAMTEWMSAALAAVIPPATVARTSVWLLASRIRPRSADCGSPSP